MIAFIAGLLSGAAGALGLGGGGVLMIYLTVIAGTEQIKAQGINLLFFIPCAAVAILIHQKEHRIKWKTVLLCIVGGLIGVTAGSALVGIIGGGWLSKIFAAFLIILGIKELFSGKQKNDTQKF